MDIEKQVVYGSNGARSDMEAARFLISGGKTYQSLYFAHLALEKALKRSSLSCLMIRHNAILSEQGKYENG